MALAMRKAVALRRLKHDWEELQQSPLHGIAAEPLADNLQEWHANLAPEHGHFAGLLLHVRLCFPDSYPADPPKVQLCTQIPHSNVIPRLGRETNFICIDMLKNFFWMGGEDSSRPYEGWSTAYSVSSILLQVQCFLFDDWAQNYDGRYKNTLWDAVIEEGGHRRTAAEVQRKLQDAQAEAVAFRCSCGHCGDKPWPYIDVPLKRIPGIHLAGDVVESVHGNSVSIRRMLGNGKFEVDLDGCVKMVGSEYFVCRLVPPWRHQPPKTHVVATTVGSKALAAKPLACQLELDICECSTADEDAASEPLRSITSSRTADRQKLPWTSIKVGMELSSRVMREMDFGFFLDCNAPVHGLLRRRGLPRDLDLKAGTCIKTFVASADPEKRRIDLVLRPKLNDAELEAKLLDGSEVAGLVVSVQAYGIFVDIGASKAGLLHVSRMGSLSVSSCKIGSEVQVQVSCLEPKLQLSVRSKPFVAPVILEQAISRPLCVEDVRGLSGNLAALPQV
eukprot:TRINITY_DN10213_c0_g1_i1.p1 TRINITY_DN10213_c0_g1~~TRINITY_DN10213_c0_g1_i1.p1  ORF type:complete len:522 (+),score=81.17 TRINITY_DN10213_c0_g1_i1:57-1568(+)